MQHLILIPKCNLDPVFFSLLHNKTGRPKLLIIWCRTCAKHKLEKITQKQGVYLKKPPNITSSYVLRLYIAYTWYVI